MFSRYSLAALVLSVVFAPCADAVPYKYFGQDAPTTAQSSVPAGGGAASARARFLADLDPTTIGTEDFSSSANTPYPGNGNRDFVDVGVFTFTGASGATVPARIETAGGQIRSTNAAGTFATSPSKYLLGQGGVQDGATYGGIRLTYQPGTGTQPFGAFGVYITDTESFGSIRITLTPVGGGTPVVLDYTGIINTGSAGNYQLPGNSQLAFVGFIDTDQSYEQIEISFADPSGTANSNELFGFDDLTVGEGRQLEASKEQTTVFSAQVADEPGWRLLSAPVEGLTVDDLALQQLVQGVPAGDGRTQQQYPDVFSNLYTAYNGGGRYDYVFAPSTGTELVPGRGFWWYWYDADINPDNNAEGGGTSQSFVLDDFGLTAIGTEIVTDVSRDYDDNTNSASDSGAGDANPDPTTNGAPDGTVSPADDDFYMIGNPYAVPFLVSGITATGGTLQDPLFAWNPSNAGGVDPDDPDPTLDGPGSYEVIFRSPLPGQQAAAAVWQGLMAEVTSPAPVGGTVSFSFAVADTTGAGDPPFYGRTGAGDAYVHFELTGTTASGAAVRDEAAYVRFTADAEDGWDAFDASKPIPPTSAYALIAPVGVRDGEALEQAVLSLPEGGSPSVALAVATGEAGTYTLAWEGSALDATLVDAVTGDEVDLRTATAYTFEAEASDWAERFTLAFASTVDATDAPAAGLLVGEPTPNPAAGDVRLRVRLDAAADVVISVYDALGRRVQTATATLPAGALESLAVPTDGLASGAYVVTVEAPGVRETRRLTITR